MKLRIQLIVLLAFCTLKCNFEEFGLRIPKNLYLRGHIDYYRQNLTGLPKGIDLDAFINDAFKLLFGGVQEIPGLIKFIVTPLEPFLFASNDADKGGFTVWGPTYSSLKEMALKWNYR